MPKLQKIKGVLINLSRTNENLSENVIKSGLWTIGVRVTQQIFNVIKLITLARILSPNDFGLMGVALLTMSTLDAFSQPGYQQALIQKKGDIKRYLDSAWTFLIFRSILMFGLLYLLSPYAAVFFNSPNAAPIIQIVGVSLIIQAFSNIGITYLQKELKFNRYGIFDLIGTFVDFVASILLVIYLRNVWGLIFGMLIGVFVRSFISYLIHDYRPSLSFDYSKAKELFGFGKWILGSNIIIYFIIQGDSILIGATLGSLALGLYQMAYKISNIPATEITHVISTVSFPAYSKIQDDIVKVKKAYLKTIRFTTLLAFPIAGFIFSFAPDFVIIFLGDKWAPIIPVIMFLSIFGAIRVINATTGPLFQALGKPKISTLGSAIQLVFMIFLIYPLTLKYGIIGTAIAIIPPNILCAIYLLIMMEKRVGIKIVDVYKHISVPLFGTLMMIFFVMTLKMVFVEISFISFFLISLFGLVVYLTTIFVLSKNDEGGLKEDFKLFKRVFI